MIILIRPRVWGCSLFFFVFQNLCLLATDGSDTQIARAKKPMNFVFFLVDDLGWADVSCFGSKFHETPNIDRLAETGMRFTHGYAACPVCSPTRASILTGRHPVRVDITDWIPGMNVSKAKNAKFRQVQDRDNLALAEVTIAEVLKSKADYTNFFAGKWHLGNKGHWPTDQGFDFNIGGNAKGSPPGGYYAPWTNPTLKANSKGEYVTERLTEESIKFLSKHHTTGREKPFLLYLSYYNVHTPITAYQKRAEYYRQKRGKLFSGATPSQAEKDGTSRMRQDNAAYASMVAAVDDSVGSIMEKLSELGMDKNTAVFFFSDNGGLCTLRNRFGPTSNLPLRSGKGWLYEGGVREPMIVRVPGIAKPGSTCEQPVVSMDFFPTMMELAGLECDPQLHADGQSLLPLLKAEPATQNERDFYWHYPHYHGSSWKPGASIRSGNMKLIEFYHENEVELYDLAEDPEEKNDLSRAKPAVVQELRGKLSRWQKKMKAKMPQPK